MRPAFCTWAKTRRPTAPAPCRDRWPWIAIDEGRRQAVAIVQLGLEHQLSGKARNWMRPNKATSAPLTAMTRMSLNAALSPAKSTRRQ